MTEPLFSKAATRPTLKLPANPSSAVPITSMSSPSLNILTTLGCTRVLLSVYSVVEVKLQRQPLVSVPGTVQGTAGRLSPLLDIFTKYDRQSSQHPSSSKTAACNPACLHSSAVNLAQSRTSQRTGVDRGSTVASLATASPNILSTAEFSCFGTLYQYKAKLHTVWLGTGSETESSK